MIWILLLLLVYVWQTVIVLVAEHRKPDKLVAWLFILYMFPIVGIVMYAFLSAEYKQREREQRRGGKPLAEYGRLMRDQAVRIEDRSGFANPRMKEAERLFGLMGQLPESPVTSRNKLEMYRAGADGFDRMLTAIESARHHIHVEMYIFRADRIGRKFQEALIRKARDGVEVRVMYDGVGSHATEKRFWQELEQAGVKVKPFLAPHLAFMAKRLNYRNHRKMIVVDGAVGFIGGLNIGDEYLGDDPQFGAWRDTHVRLEGDAVYGLQHTFLTSWMHVGGDRVEPAEVYFPKLAEDWDGEAQVQIVACGPDEQEETMLRFYFTAITSAQHRVWLTTPYFVPDPSLLMALKIASLCGADVRVVIPGLGDSKLALNASISFAEELMRAGVRVYRYQKGFIHAKTFILDRTLAVCGSTNFDMRSFYHNFEVSAVLFDQAAIDDMAAGFEQDVAESREMTLAEVEKRSRKKRFGETVARMLAPLL